MNILAAAPPTGSNHPAASRGSSNWDSGSEDLCPPRLGASAPSTAQQSGPRGGHQGSWEVGSEHDHWRPSNIEISYSLPCAVMRLLPSSCTGDTPGRPWDTTTRLRSCMTDTCTETWIHTAATSMLSNRSLRPRPLPPARSPKAKFPISSAGPASYDDVALLPCPVHSHQPSRGFWTTPLSSSSTVQSRCAHLLLQAAGPPFLCEHPPISVPCPIDDTAETLFSFLLDASPSTYIASCSREDWPEAQTFFSLGVTIIGRDPFGPLAGARPKPGNSPSGRDFT